MDLTPYVTALRDDLAAAASVGDEQTARAGTALAGALEPAVRLALQSALADLTAEISAKLDDRSVSLRLRGREVEVVVDQEGPATAAAEEPASGFFAGPSSSPFAGPGGPFRRPGFDAPGAAGRGADMGDISRMTLRLVDQIKGQAEQAAAAQGMSLNSWISQAVQGALRDNLGRHGQRRWEGSWDPQQRSDERPGPPPASPSDESPSGKPDPGRDDDDGSGGSGVSGWVRG
ncbi:toxin-antitoxin system HicB family antitoxin [Actinomycetospora soli]|uniref:toxin-antitoxin system HicB family antitoxin n=1 Tax=Actinomycetospora soli TaxID=2893887 RepID=UPI001E2AE67D|nr:toxin-antitoxin system HicB family antitoxin [Actinomycetospora soli]MCD2189687.1 toxin-antitoxin system HicB family antitoxin [Actinomycetospora soli]